MTGTSASTDNREMTVSTRTYTRTIPVEEPTDVLVVGSGPAGLAAAVAAARSGASVRLVERFGYLGGNLTAGLVGPCMTSFSLDGQTQLVRGVFDEFIRAMEARGGAVHPSQTKGGTPYSGFIRFGHDAVTPFDPEAAKRVAQEMVLAENIDLLLHTWAVDTVVENGVLRGVVVANKSGMSYLPAGAVIDATGDGDIAALAGAEFAMGREGDGLMQPMTLFFRIGNVDDEAVEQYKRDHPEELFPFQSIVEEATRTGRYTLPRRGVQLFKTLEPGVWRINTTRVLGLDGTDAADLTRGEITARRQVDVLMDFFRQELPGLADCTLIDTAATIGVRESRRVVGEYELTLDDLVTGRHFDDVIAVAGYPVDIHSPSSDQGPFDDGIPPTANEYEIPYRSLVPAQVDGLLVTGRCISATHEALAAVRVMPPSFAMGEAAGIAAAQAVDAGHPVRAAGVEQLQAELIRRGAHLGSTHAAAR